MLQFSLFEQAPSPPHPPAAPLPPDAAARAEALDIQRSFIVEAPAGSGKTGLLMQRFLRLLATVDDPAELLAITFTRKATGELRDRIFAQLLSAAAGTQPDGAFEQATRILALAVLEHDARRGWQLLDSPGRLNIRTIDSLAGELAATGPVLAAGGANPTDDATPLHAEAARRTLMQLGGPDPVLSADLQVLLLHRDNDLGNCERLIAEMLSLRDQWLPLIPATELELTDVSLDTHILPRLNGTLGLVICRAMTALARQFPPHLLQDLCTLAAAMGHSPGYNGAHSPLAFCAGNPTPPGQLVHHLEHWIALANLLLKKESEFRKPTGLSGKNLLFDITKPHKLELGRIIEATQHNDSLREHLHAIRHLPPAAYPAEDWLVTRCLLRILANALQQLQHVFNQNGACDFTEVSLRAAQALRSETSSGELPAGARLQHILVDEMQDTSAGQYQLLELLTQHWDGASQTLFLVGDPRQSIYLFRQARVERFLYTLHTASFGSGPDAIPLTGLRLTANFRSQQRLVQAFNQDFSLIFPPASSTPLNSAEADPLPYTLAQPTRPASFASAAAWHAHLLPAASHSEERTRIHRRQLTRDAADIARTVLRWQATPHPEDRPWRIAVLVAARTHLVQVVRALRQQAIPYRAVRVEPLRERQEILDLLALTRALLHPADRAAWLSLLRTPWCGLGLADLHLLAGADELQLASLTILEAISGRSHLLTPDGQARLAAFHAVITAALARRGTLPISQWISRTWHAFGASAFTDPASLLNTERFFALLDELTAATGMLDLAGLDRRLETLFAAPSLAPGAVDLMTIHSAKGLEWDVVFIPALERRGGSSSHRLLAWLEVEPEPGGPHAIAPGLIAPIFAKGAEKGALQQWIWDTHADREFAERKRVFYVACTRAREELHLFASTRVKSDKSLERHPSSLLAAAWPAALPGFPEPASPVAEPAAPEPAATILQMPAPAEPGSLALAAAAEPPQPRTIRRIPIAAFTLPPSLPPAPAASAGFERPQGSLAARAIGNTLHSLLELLAQMHAAGDTFPALQQQIPQWRPRIVALLRSAGLASAQLEPLVPTIQRGLTQTLADPHGQWLLTPHPRAASEAALTSAALRGIRLDRTFLAGPAPLSPGATHLWIVDFKTATHGRRGLEAFLHNERETYSPQLHTYAAALAPLGYPIRLALYYPLLPALTTWSPAPANP